LAESKAVHVARSGWHDGARETHRARFLQARLHARNAAHLASQTDLPDGDHVVRHRFGPLRAEHGCGDGQIETRVPRAEAADDVGEDFPRLHVPLKQRFDHADEKLEAAGVHALATPPGARDVVADDQSLHLKAERAASLDRDTHDGAGARLATLREQALGGVAHLVQPVFAHLEEPDLIGWAVAILDAPQDTERGVPFPLEEQDHIDGMLQHARPRDASDLRYLPDEQEYRARAAGDRHELIGCRSHLRRTPGCPRDSGGL